MWIHKLHFVGLRKKSEGESEAGMEVKKTQPVSKHEWMALN